MDRRVAYGLMRIRQTAPAQRGLVWPAAPTCCPGRRLSRTAWPLLPPGADVNLDVRVEVGLRRRVDNAYPPAMVAGMVTVYGDVVRWPLRSIPRAWPLGHRAGRVPQFPAPARRRRFAQRSMASAGRPGSPGIRPAHFANKTAGATGNTKMAVEHSRGLSGEQIDCRLLAARWTDRPVNEDVRELTDEEVTSSGE